MIDTVTAKALAAFSLLVLLVAACGHDDKANAVWTAPPTNALRGSIDHATFTPRSSLGKWSSDGRTLLVELDSWIEDCGFTSMIPDGGTEAVIAIPRAMLAIGTYQAEPASFAVDPPGIEVSVAAYFKTGSGSSTEQRRW